MRYRTIGIAMAVAALAVSAAQAATPIYSSPSNDGNQSFTGMLGNDFQVNNDFVQLTALGAFTGSVQGFDEDTTISVGLYDVTTLYDNDNSTNLITAVIAPISFTQASPGTWLSSYSYKNVAPVMLESGKVYSIQASGFNTDDDNFNTNIGGATQSFDTLGGALTQRLGRWSTMSTLGIAGTTSGGDQPNTLYSFGGGSALVAVVPESETWAMMLAGLGLVGLQLRRKGKVAKEIAVN
jgi:hypothetical protein